MFMERCGLVGLAPVVYGNVRHGMVRLGLVVWGCVGLGKVWFMFMSRLCLWNGSVL